MNESAFEYVSYISSTQEKVWNALIDPKLTAVYWQHENVSDWKPGSRWEHRSCEEKDTVDLVGKVIECTPPSRLVLSWAFPCDETHEEKHSRVTLTVEPFREVVRLIVRHDRLKPGTLMLAGITEGWPMVLSSLKTLLELGKPLPRLW
jgi:uncharacterized protein YndB with AHSA1/START domain